MHLNLFLLVMCVPVMVISIPCVPRPHFERSNSFLAALRPFPHWVAVCASALHNLRENCELFCSLTQSHIQSSDRGNDVNPLISNVSADVK